jgi:hypothetical protein
MKRFWHLIVLVGSQCVHYLLDELFTTRNMGTKHFIHFVVKFMEIHYNEFVIKNVNKKWTISELKLVLLTKWRHNFVHIYFVHMWILKFSFLVSFTATCSLYIWVLRYYVLLVMIKWPKRKRVYIWKFYYFQIYIGFKLYKILPNYDPRGNLINHPCF